MSASRNAPCALRVQSSASITRPARESAMGWALGVDCPTRIDRKLNSATESRTPSCGRSSLGNPASEISIRIAPSGRSALSIESNRAGESRKYSSPRRSAMPSMPGATRVAASLIVRPRSGVAVPQSSISIESALPISSPKLSRTRTMDSWPSAFANARPSARRSISPSPPASSPMPTSRPCAVRRRTTTIEVPLSGIAAAESSSCGRFGASSQRRAVRKASIADSSAGASEASSGVAVVVCAAQTVQTDPNGIPSTQNAANKIGTRVKLWHISIGRRDRSIGTMPAKPARYHRVHN